MLWVRPEIVARIGAGSYSRLMRFLFVSFLKAVARRLFFCGLNQLTGNISHPITEVTITLDLIIKVGEYNGVVSDDWKDSEAQDVQQILPSSEEEILLINKTSCNRCYTDRTVWRLSGPVRSKTGQIWMKLLLMWLSWCDRRPIEKTFLLFTAVSD